MCCCMQGSNHSKIVFQVDIVAEEDYPRFAQPSLLVATRHLRDILISKGYVVSYNEYSGSHEHINWQYSLGEGLIYLLME